MTNFIGKKVTVSIGGPRPKNDGIGPNDVVGENIFVHVDEQDLGKYNRIVGEEVTLTLGDMEDTQKNFEDKKRTRKSTIGVNAGFFKAEISEERDI